MPEITLIRKWHEGCISKRMADSNRAVYAAIGANIAIAITKFAAGAATGSVAMLSEGVHSVVDTADGCLLLLGRSRSARPPDPEHPFGHGQELYFWTLTVAVMIFAVGGGASVIEGILHLVYPAAAENPKWAYIVLGTAGVFESISFAVGFRQFREEERGRGFWSAVRSSKDPTTFTVVFEDAADLLGILVAFLGVLLGHLLHNPAYDAAASIVIGAILMAVSALLVRESKGLLIGEGVDRETAGEICRLAEADAVVERVNHPLTMHFGPNTILLAMEIQFRKGITAAELTSAVDRIENAIHARYPEIRHIFIESESISAQAKDQPRAA